ncbi:MAG: hypothetical protein ACTSWN_16935 [Promethearchaeota archaeon]
MTYKTLIVTDFDEETFDWTTKIAEEDIAFIIDDGEKVIYVWNGRRASHIKKYKAGTLATKIKSLYQYYGFKTEVINQGEEMGPLKAEIDKLLEGKGTPVSEDYKATHRPISTSALLKKAVTAIPSREVPTPPKMVVGEPRKSRIMELEEELEKEKKKSQHKINKLKEVHEALKQEYEEKIKSLEDELDRVKKSAISEDELNEKISVTKKQAENTINALKIELNFMKEKLEKAESLSSKIEELEREKEQLTDANEKLKSQISSMQEEIIDFKQKLEAAENKAKASEEINEYKEKLSALEKELSEEREKSKSSEAKISELKKELEAAKQEIEKQKKKIQEAEAGIKEEYEERLTDYEDKYNKLKEKNAELERKVIELQDELKKNEELTFAPVEDIPQGAKNNANAGLTFVNPYASGELGAKIDPLTDLKSFLNTVDPSKPIDPELRNLLNTLINKLENDEEIIKALIDIQKQAKDEKLTKLVEDLIDKIKSKQQ